MVITPRPVSRAAIEEVHDSLHRVIYAIATRHALRYGIDFNEAKARADLLFLEAYHQYTPRRGRMIDWVTFYVPRRLHDEERDAARRGAILAPVECVLESLEDDDGPRPRFDRSGFVRRLSPEARLVVDFVLDGTAERQANLRHGYATPAKVRAEVRRYMKAGRWPRWLAVQVFAEIRGAL